MWLSQNKVEKGGCVCVFVLWCSQEPGAQMHLWVYTAENITLSTLKNDVCLTFSLAFIFKEGKNCSANVGECLKLFYCHSWHMDVLKCCDIVGLFPCQTFLCLSKKVFTLSLHMWHCCGRSNQFQRQMHGLPLLMDHFVIFINKVLINTK